MSQQKRSRCAEISVDVLAGIFKPAIEAHGATWLKYPCGADSQIDVGQILGGKNMAAAVAGFMPAIAADSVGEGLEAGRRAGRRSSQEADQKHVATNQPCKSWHSLDCFFVVGTTGLRASLCGVFASGERADEPSLCGASIG